MPIRTSILALLAILCLPLPALAQSADTADEPAEAFADQPDEQTIGTLQAELAQLEAERQRLADALAAGADSMRMERLTVENRDLQEQLSVMQDMVDVQQKDEQRKWFIVGGATVAASLLLGWLLAQLGGRRKRSMWLN